MIDSDGPVRVLLLGGTTEAREIAIALERAGVRVIASLAGRTQDPFVIARETRIGGFGGASGLANWLGEHGFAAVIDATHPFSTRISRSIAEACEGSNTPLVRLDRPGWCEQQGDRWHRVDSEASAAALVPRLGARVFLTVGRQRLDAFAGTSDTWFLIRSIDPPEPPLPARHEVVLDRGPFTVESERQLLLQHRIDLVVTRDSGGASTGAKLIAARELDVPVIMISRPIMPESFTVSCASQAVDWAHAVIAAGRA